MSYSTSKWISPGEKTNWVFSWGYVDNTPNITLWESFSPYLRNARLDGASIIIRPWHSLFAPLTTGSYPKGIGSYLRTSAANDVMIVRHNISGTQKLNTITAAGVVASITTGADIASDNRMSFTNVADTVYCLNGSDGLGLLSGTTYTVPSTWVSNFAPAFSVIFNGSQWASGWSSNPNKVYKSIAGTYSSFSGAWSDTFTFEETITGLAASNQALFYFTANSVSVTGVGDITDTAWVLTYTNRRLKVKEWAVNNASIVAAGNEIYYWTSSNTISKIATGSNINGFEVLDMGARKYRGIEKILATLDVDQTASFGYFVSDKNLIKWFVKTAGSTLNDVCIIYDITKDAFLIDSGKFFYWGLFYKGFNYTISMVEPKVYQDEYAQDDEDSGIAFEYWTKEFYISDPTLKKILWESRTLLDINELASCTQEIWIDEVLQDTKTVWITNFVLALDWLWTPAIGIDAVGEVGWGDGIDNMQEIYILRTKWNLNKKWRKIQFRFTNSTVAWRVRLKNISMKVEVLSHLTTNLTN